MVPYLLTGLAVVVAFIIHWFAPKSFWGATLMSSAVILLLSIAALYIFQASGVLISERTGENVDFSGHLLFITVSIGFFGLLVSVFVGWFLRVMRAP
ncbi:hypothetical protein [Alteromonas halophila]|uniref:Uncharacterized protein n=1 Tax=Alteromonas halophila TaxID=516698 RepID=A0A918JHJ4_9ALTE|nr:hypothetical protein [Alteromonas halophila]GGW80301.1 hypothetical protein GCM10007391_11490 [Alteromonas halophila]